MTASHAPMSAPSHEDVVDAFMGASRAIVGLTARTLSGVADVSLPQFRALVVLTSRSPCHVGDLAAALDVNPSSATRLVDRLVRLGLCRRSRDPQDRRAVRVQLTKQGREVVADVTRKRREEIEKLLKAVPVEQHAALVTALQSVSTALGEVSEPDFQAGLNTASAPVETSTRLTAVTVLAMAAILAAMGATSACATAEQVSYVAPAPSTAPHPAIGWSPRDFDHRAVGR